MNESRESGFTLPELIMSITILGVIGAVIGGVLVAAFSTTTGINERFDASRASKQASLYWTPDVRSAETVNPPGAICGSGEGALPSALITLAWNDHPPVTGISSPEVDAGARRVATWWLDDATPAQITRRICDGDALDAPTEAQRITTRIADSSDDTASLAERAAAARGQVATECSTDGVAFHGCGADDPAPIVRLTVRVLDVPAPADPEEPGRPRFKTYEFRVADTRAVR